MINLLNTNKKVVIILIIFMLGLYYVIKYPSVEGFTSKNILGNRCPNILIQKGSEFYLHNSKIAEVPGVNPLRFSNLDEYVEFTKWQRSQGILCPILYVQESYDAQGKRVYKARPSPTDLQGGLPDYQIQQEPSDQAKLLDASHDDQSYNINNYPGFDPQNQYVGLDTPLDKMFQESKSGISPNPMDPNWGGAKYTQSLVDKGYYKDNEVSIAIS
jgi:hypothetical protein